MQMITYALSKIRQKTTNLVHMLFNNIVFTIIEKLILLINVYHNFIFKIAARLPTNIAKLKNT